MAQSALVIRKKKGGEVVLQGDLPKKHVFSARWLDREIDSGLVTVTVTVHASEGDLVYEVTGYERNENPETGEPDENSINYSGLKAKRVEG